MPLQAGISDAGKWAQVNILLRDEINVVEVLVHTVQIIMPHLLTLLGLHAKFNIADALLNYGISMKCLCISLL
ncbi:hypothetical protein C3B51_07045 [Pseudoalteromonas rubra]|uniref:Uncharacterized protein n=1 Tax=Pseudoalteromonas rubra TaxID=43658 RepID=A0A4Q7EIX1_9GAMM|nr:hypothetical protein C3B51_07045 [Pseudoalteromonas rubra]